MKSKHLAIIVSYNGLPEIIQCIESLQRGTYLPDVLIIDNHSTDDTVIKVEKLGIDCIRLQENIGFGNAMNIGLKFALDKEYEGVFLINQDVVVEKNCIQYMLNADDKSHLISPVHFAKEVHLLDRNFDKMLEMHKINTKRATWKDAVKHTQFSFVNAAFWYIPAALLNKIGGFHPAFFFTGEDVNYCDRLIYHGASIKIETRAEILHQRTRKLDSITDETRIKKASAEADILQFLLNINDSFALAYIKCCAFPLKDFLVKADYYSLRMRLYYLARWTKSSGQIRRWRAQMKQPGPHFIS